MEGYGRMAGVLENDRCVIVFSNGIMKSYRLLIIAWYVNLYHPSEFIRNLKKINPGVDISLMYSKPIVEAIPEDLYENTEELICVKTYSGRIRIKLFRILADRILFLKSFIHVSKQKYDIVNIHYAKPRLSYVMSWIKRSAKTIVISPWGSDVLRVEGESRIKHLRKVYSLASYVTVSKDSNIGKQVIEKFGVDSNKLVKLGWGGDLFDFIQNNKSSVSIESAKERFGLNGRFVITCGYNPQIQQRHEEIINAINGIRDQLPDNLTLLFPFTYGYGGLEYYRESIKEKAKGLGIPFVSVEERLNMSDLLKLRMATDIFVHIQTTDAGSRSVMEYVLLNKKVVHGSWIKYAYLEKYRPSCYFPIDRLEDLGECILKAYNTKIGPLPQEVMDIIMARGWKQRMILWNSFFESVI